MTKRSDKPGASRITTLSPMHFVPLGSDQMVVQDLTDEVCLMRLDTNEVLVLNRTATDVWLLVSDGLDEEQATQTLANAYGTCVELIAAQVRSVVSDLCEHGFLTETA